MFELWMCFSPAKRFVQSCVLPRQSMIKSSSSSLSDGDPSPASISGKAFTGGGQGHHQWCKLNVFLSLGWEQILTQLHWTTCVTRWSDFGTQIFIKYSILIDITMTVSKVVWSLIACPAGWMFRLSIVKKLRRNAARRRCADGSNHKQQWKDRSWCFPSCVGPIQSQNEH